MKSTARTPRRFVLRPDQTDYTHRRLAPVVNCIVRHGGKILLVERSRDLHFYPGLWNGVSGFLDDRKSAEEKAREELREELGVKRQDIEGVRAEKAFRVEALEYRKTWIVHPVLADVAATKIKLDWEARRHRWVRPEALRDFRLVPGFAEAAERALRGREHLLRFRRTDAAIFEALRNGTKKVETRAATGKYRAVRAGDTLVFKCGSRMCKKKARNISYAANLRGLLRNYRARDINPAAPTPAGLAAMYRKFPGYARKLKRYGLVAFEF